MSSFFTVPTALSNECYIVPSYRSRICNLHIKGFEYNNHIFFRIFELWKFDFYSCLLILNGYIRKYSHLQYAHFFAIFQNMPICNMPIFLKILKYAHLQYAHFFEKMGIFQYRNMPKKTTYGSRADAQQGTCSCLQGKGIPTSGDCSR